MYKVVLDALTYLQFFLFLNLQQLLVFDHFANRPLWVLSLVVLNNSSLQVILDQHHIVILDQRQPHDYIQIRLYLIKHIKLI